MDLEGVFGPESIHQEPGPHLASIPPLFSQVRKLASYLLGEAASLHTF